MGKKRAYLRNELNLTQEEMAMLLKTKRLQLALYELESRELPSIASKRLTAIEFFMATAKAPEAKDYPMLEEEKEKFLELQSVTIAAFEKEKRAVDGLRVRAMDSEEAMAKAEGNFESLL